MFSFPKTIIHFRQDQRSIIERKRTKRRREKKMGHSRGAKLDFREVNAARLGSQLCERLASRAGPILFPKVEPPTTWKGLWRHPRVCDAPWVLPDITDLCPSSSRLADAVYAMNYAARESCAIRRASHSNEQRDSSRLASKKND